MTNEEMENKIEFLLKQQESFGDSQREIYNLLHELAERQETTQAQVDKTQTQVDKTNEAMFGLVGIVGHVARSLEASQKANDARSKELADRLDIFINVLERYISENRNGEHGKES